jgi:hypothetical protein
MERKPAKAAESSTSPEFSKAFPSDGRPQRMWGLDSHPGNGCATSAS